MSHCPLSRPLVRSDRRAVVGQRRDPSLLSRVFVSRGLVSSSGALRGFKALMSARLPTSSSISQACAEFLDSYLAARCYDVVLVGLSCDVLAKKCMSMMESATSDRGFVYLSVWGPAQKSRSRRLQC